MRNSTIPMKTTLVMALALAASGCGGAAGGSLPKLGELVLAGLVEGPPEADLSGWLPLVMSRDGASSFNAGFVEDYEAFQRHLRYGTREGERYRVGFPADWADGELAFYADIDGDGRFTPDGTDPVSWARGDRLDLAALARAGEHPPVKLKPFSRLSAALDLPPGMPSAGFGPTGPSAHPRVDARGATSSAARIGTRG